ncbi:MAG: DUF4097 domain-containing protein [Lactobacillales bacterium]|jgi:DUF4097 and DUF4098 domain-containing protein YvlB|nr:DUF4097 domain-containing protein [Lactobacillales bacterium]
MNVVNKKIFLAFDSVVVLLLLFLLASCSNSSDKSVQSSKTAEMSKDFNVDEIDNLKINSGIMDVEIGEGSTFHLNVKYLEKRKPKIEVKSKTLNFDSKTKNLSNNNKKLGLEITLPTNKEFINFEITQSNGDVEIQRLKTQSLTISSGNGNIAINKLATTKASSISSGNASISLSDSTVPGLNISVANGSVEVHGKEVKGKYQEGDQKQALKITTGNGSIEVK